jgi:hypothetical protein
VHICVLKEDRQHRVAAKKIKMEQEKEGVRTTSMATAWAVLC